jgi:hypothetical protein
MTPEELYKLLDYFAVDYEVVEIFEGVRILRVEVIDKPEDDNAN